MTEEAPYYVWRRGDGYVGCTRYNPFGRPSTSTFVVLVVTSDWDEALSHMTEERKDQRHIECVGRWSEDT